MACIKFWPWGADICFLFQRAGMFLSGLQMAGILLWPAEGFFTWKKLVCYAESGPVMQKAGLLWPAEGW